jgi:hypothetical protein
MTLKTKNVTHIAILSLMVGLAVWISVHTFAAPKPTHVVGVVEVGAIQ